MAMPRARQRHLLHRQREDANWPGYSIPTRSVPGVTQGPLRQEIATIAVPCHQLTVVI